MKSIQSTIIVFDGEVIQDRIDQLGDVNIISIKPGEMVERGRGDDLESVTTTEITFERRRFASDPVVEHIDQIAIAIFSMASSIIGFYFGTRSQVPAFGGSRDNDGGRTVVTPPDGPDGKADSPDWSLGAAKIPLTLQNDAYVGEIEFASDELTEDQEFAGLIVPPKDNREKYKAFRVAVEREGQVLSIEIVGPDTPTLAGAQISLYPVDHEDVAIAVEIEFE